MSGQMTRTMAQARSPDHRNRGRCASGVHAPTVRALSWSPTRDTQHDGSRAAEAIEGCSRGLTCYGGQRGHIFARHGMVGENTARVNAQLPDQQLGGMSGRKSALSRSEKPRPRRGVSSRRQNRAPEFAPVVSIEQQIRHRFAPVPSGRAEPVQEVAHAFRQAFRVRTAIPESRLARAATHRRAPFRCHDRSARARDQTWLSRHAPRSRRGFEENARGAARNLRNEGIGARLQHESAEVVGRTGRRRRQECGAHQMQRRRHGRSAHRPVRV